MEHRIESDLPDDGELRLASAIVAGVEGTGPRTEEPLAITLRVDADAARVAQLHVGVSEGPATPIFVLSQKGDVGPSGLEARCRLPRLPLPRGRYFLWVGATDHGGRDLLAWRPVTSFDVEGPDLDPAPGAVVRLAPLHVPAEWELEPTR